MAEDVVPVKVRGGHQWGMAIVSDMLQAFCASRGIQSSAFDVNTWDDWKNLERLSQGACDILVHYSNRGETDAIGMQNGGNEDANAGYSRYMIGQARVLAVANRNNAVEGIKYSDVQRALWVKGKDMKWPEGNRGTKVIKPHCEKAWGVAWLILRRSCMLARGQFTGPFRAFRDDLDCCQNDDEVLQKVGKDANSIGFILYRSPLAQKNVKVLSVGDKGCTNLVAPKLAPVIQEDYPLSEPIVLYLNPDAPPLARQFCEFASGGEGAKIAEKYGLVTPWEQWKYEGDCRLMEMKHGKGTHLSAIGVRVSRTMMPDLAAEYVRANQVVQLSFEQADAEVAAIYTFVKSRAGSRELLLLDDKPSERALRVYGEDWKTLQPIEYVPAGRCSDELWMRLARWLEKDRPADAIPIYQAQVQRTLRRTGNEPYRQAVRHIHEIEKLLKRANRSGEFSAYLQSLRSEYRRKRNFVATLDKLGQGGASE
jgi:hypothetical protein